MLIGIKRHEFNKTNFDPVRTSKLSKFNDLIIIDVTDYHHVELHQQPGTKCSINASEYLCQRAPACEIAKVSECSESNETLTRCNPADTRRCAIFSNWAPFVVIARSTCKGRSNEINASTSGRTSGSPPVMRIASNSKYSTQTRAICREFHECQFFFMRQPIKTFFGHAISAAKIASIRNRQAQVTYLTVICVDKGNRH